MTTDATGERPGSTVVGLVLAGGAGSRMGRPKALVRGADGRPWVERAVRTLLDGGCATVVVVLGAAADVARPLVPDHPAVRVVVAGAWAEGLGASLRAGLVAVADGDRAPGDRSCDDDGARGGADAVLVTLVDLPELPVAAVRRLLEVEPPGPSGPHGGRRARLRQAMFGDRPGHPVLVGRAHWAPLATSLHGDRGAGAYLRSHGVERVECGDLWDGADHDRPAGSTP
ncbi:nucleotidyltransferase family protein [Curtobacterium sp. MCBD17_035]|uniref:nucleotidyltransferase family protein n=1 Tax=Curtobacterium sp. MCBD17_035 TaxID=2175673 RepID=UPI0021ACC827|nr:nucleotidyltransferase family protein [Curtobacterium sp. MCBD17_035]WIB68971.1 nucleotidyltransferase family protein [Curtobacterium sp. MCBD17_035]